jgi:hypothetical protein
MVSALWADAARYVSRVGPMLEVVSAHGVQSGFQRSRPVLIGSGESSDLVRAQAKVTEHRPERLAVVNRIDELLAYLDRESLLRFAPEARPRGVVLCFTASVAVAAFQPAGKGAVGHLRATAATLGIGLVTDLM